MVDIEIIKLVNDVIMSGNIKVLDVFNGFFILKIIIIKNELVVNVDDEYSLLSLYCRFFNVNFGVFFEI